MSETVSAYLQDLYQFCGLFFSDLELRCGLSGSSPAGPLNVDCSVTGGEVQTVICNYDNGFIVENCSLDFALSFDRFSPGDHSVTITAVTSDGRSVSVTLGFSVPPEFG